MLAAASSVFFLSAVCIVLQTLLLPRHLDPEWHLSSVEDGLVSTVFFGGNTVGLLVLGFVGGQHGLQPVAVVVEN